jgi:hypothetical protein
MKANSVSCLFCEYWLHVYIVKFSLVSTTEELRGRKSSGSRLESQEYDRRNPSRLPRVTVFPQKSPLTSPTNCGHSVGIVRSRTQAKEFSFIILLRLTLCIIPGMWLWTPYQSTKRMN